MYKISTRYIDNDGDVMHESDKILDEEYKIFEYQGFKKIRFHSGIYDKPRVFLLDELGVNWVKIIDEDGGIILYHHNDNEETLEEWRKELKVNIDAMRVNNEWGDLKKVAEIAEEVMQNIRRIHEAEKGWE